MVQVTLLFQGGPSCQPPLMTSLTPQRLVAACFVLKYWTEPEGQAWHVALSPCPSIIHLYRVPVALVFTWLHTCIGKETIWDGPVCRLGSRVATLFFIVIWCKRFWTCWMVGPRLPQLIWLVAFHLLNCCKKKTKMKEELNTFFLRTVFIGE
jgi:hypothetical protein